MKFINYFFICCVTLLFCSEPHPLLILKKTFPREDVHLLHGSYFTSSFKNEIVEINAETIAKIYFFNEEKDKILFEQDQKAFLFAASLQLPTPTLLQTTENALIMEKAKGISFDELLQEIGKNFPQEEPCFRLCHAMRSIARSLAQLHGTEGNFSSPIKSYSDRTSIKHFLKRKDDLNLSFQEEKFLTYIHSLKISHKPRKSLIHKDLHPGNIFIDESKQKTTLIDLTTLQTGDTYYDVALFLTHFEAVATFYGISLDTQQKALQTFFHEYNKHIPLHQKNLSYPLQIVAIELIEDYAEIPTLSNWAKNHFYEQIF